MSVRGRSFSHAIARSCRRFRCCRKAASDLGVMPRHHQRAQRRRRAHRHQQRQAHGEQEGDRQRPEKCALQSGHHQDRQKRHRHRRRRVEHRPAHLERGADEQRADVHVTAAPRRRRRMFSTSMTASSTTTPSATTRPPSVMVLRLNPQAPRIQTVVSRASGIALKETNAPRQSRSVISNSATTSTAPIGQRIAQLLDRAFDEAGRPQQRRMVLHPCLASAGASASSLTARAPA